MTIVMATTKYYKKEAKAFVEKHPEYIPNDANKDALFERLREKEMDMNRDTLDTVYKELKAEGKIEVNDKVISRFTVAQILER